MYIVPRNTHIKKHNTSFRPTHKHSEFSATTRKNLCRLSTPTHTNIPGRAYTPTTTTWYTPTTMTNTTTNNNTTRS